MPLVPDNYNRLVKVEGPVISALVRAIMAVTMEEIEKAKTNHTHVEPSTDEHFK